MWFPSIGYVASRIVRGEDSGPFRAIRLLDVACAHDFLGREAGYVGPPGTTTASAPDPRPQARGRPEQFSAQCLDDVGIGRCDLRPPRPVVNPCAERSVLPHEIGTPLQHLFRVGGRDLRPRPGREVEQPRPWASRAFPSKLAAVAFSGFWADRQVVPPGCCLPIPGV